MKKLPIGIQTFSKIIEGDYLYIDKTAIALNLIENYQYVFLSRPRRFGKSLFIDTLHNIFEGKKELFKNLDIYDKWNWDIAYPVIKITFSSGIYNKNDLHKNLFRILEVNQKRLNVECTSNRDANIYFDELIEHTYKEYNQKVVILIDEYDKPILDNLDNVEQAKIIRDYIKDFYTKIKDNDQYIRFAFLTGVSKFSKTSIFSGLNNIVDISLNPEYGNICGYTQNDIETSFKKYLADVNLSKLKLWYNGYSFLKDKVYNPFDILLFIQQGKLYHNYWFETGTPTFLINLLKTNNYFLPRFENIEADESSINNFDLENLDLETIMFQSGYLTIKNVFQTSLGVKYILGFPNLEVKISFNNAILSIFSNKNQKESLRFKLLEIFESGNIAELEFSIKQLFSSIAYNNFTKNEIANYEGFYASVLYAYFASLGLEIIAEDVTSYGRIDLTIKLNTFIYIFEFKINNDANSNVIEEPLQQIKKKKYYDKYIHGASKISTHKKVNIYIIGIVFDKKTKNILQFEWEQI